MIAFEGYETAANDFPQTFDVMIEGEKCNFVLRGNDLF